VKILFTSTHETSFIREDLTLLRKSFNVQHLITRGAFAAPKILMGILSSDITFTWFASVYSAIVVFFGRVCGKRSVVVVGGVDAARYPEISYGIWISRWKAPLVRYAMMNAHRLLIVDPSLEKQVRELAGYHGENIECLPTGFDPSVWTPGRKPKEGRVLAAAACNGIPRMKVKGLPFLLEAARLMSDVPFTIIGPGDKMAAILRKEAPPNVEVFSFIPREELLSQYQGARVYCQPSVFEGLPSSVCEAMLCECIPVGTNVGGIPTAIGDAGFLVRYGNVGELVGALRQALDAPEEMGKKARRHVEQHYNLEKREAGLKRVVQEAAG